MSSWKANKAKPAPILQSILKEITDFQGWELIFKISLSGFLIWSVYSLKILYNFRTYDEWAHVEKASILDFKYSLLMVIFFYLYKKGCVFLFSNLAKTYLSHEKFPTVEERNKKAELHSQWIGSTIYYTASTLSAFFLFKDQEFFPTQLGGVGEYLGMFKTWPHPPQIPYGVAFYMIQFGKHLHTLVDHIIYKRKDHKFWEMFLHHALAVFLIFFSYASSHIAIGILVLFVHDPCDVFFCINRILNDSQYKGLFFKALAYVVFLASWIFFRLIAFPRSIIAPAFKYISLSEIEDLSPLLKFMAAMLVGLLVLHFYWGIFIVRAGAVMIFKKGANINIYDKTKNTERVQQ